MNRNSTLRYFLLIAVFSGFNTICSSSLIPIPDSYASRLTSSPTDYFRSRNSGTWMDINTWESSADNLVWVNATIIPTASAREILIYNNQTVSLGGDVNARSLIIEADGFLSNPGPGGGYDLIIEKDVNATEAEFKIYGTYLLFGKQPVFQDGSLAVVYENAVVKAEDNIGGGSDGFARNPLVYFKTNAVFEWNTENAFTTSGATYFPNSGAADIPVFRVSANPGDVGTGSLAINGILEVNTDFTFIGGSNKLFRNGITGNSTLTQNGTSGNRFTINGTNAILGGSSLTLSLSFPLNLESSVTVAEESFVTILGANINNAAEGNIFTIEGTLDVTSHQITNTNGSVVIQGLYRTSNVGSTTSELSSIPSGLVTTLPGSTVEFYLDGNQTYKSRSDFSNIIFSGSGIKRASSGFNPNGTITIMNFAILDSRGQNIGDGNTKLTMMDNSRLILNTTGRNPSMDGGYHLTGGTIQFDNSDATKQTIRGTYGPEPGIAFAYNQIEVTGKSVGNGSGNILLGEKGKLIIKSGGVFEINANAIKAAPPGSSNQQVIIESGAEFKTGNKLGFHGLESTEIPIGVSSIHANISNIELQSNSSVNYHRDSTILEGGNQIITSTLPYQHLIISGNGEKTVQENGMIEIKEDLTKPTGAIFKHNGSSAVFNGPGAQNYESAFPQMVFNNLINYNTIGLNILDSLSIFRTLTLGEYSIINIAADITLQSDLENTANVASIPSNANIQYSPNHAFIVERYIPDHYKAWQFLAIPVYGNQTIHQAWQEGMPQGMSELNNAPGAPGNLKPGYGTTITSNRPSWSADGFDLYTAPGPSLKTFNSLINQWEGVTATHIPIENEKGYMLMVRGDRSVIAHNQDATPTTLRIRGKIFEPAILPPVTFIPNIPGLFISVGNPYPSAIDFYKTARTNLGESYIIWDPQLTNGPYSAYGLGAFRTISNGYAVPGSGNYVDDGIPPIQSGQAFFVQLANNASAAGSLTFSEESKVPGSSLIFRGENVQKAAAHLRVNLFAVVPENLILLDGTLVLFHDEYSPEINKYDALKMYNPGENIGIFSNSKTLAIERRPSFLEKDTLIYTLSGLRKQVYQLEFSTQKTDLTGLDAFVEDVYLNQKTFLDPSGKTLIRFQVNNAPGSFDKNRFRVIFESAKRPLPVTTTHFSAKLENNAIHIRWQSENESGIARYRIEKSSNGFLFNPLGEVAPKKGISNHYHHTDKDPVPGNNYYRLKITAENGIINYSEIVKVYKGVLNPSFSIYPNPIHNDKINLHLINQPEGKYTFRILTKKGQTIAAGHLDHKGGKAVKTFNVNTAPNGLYYLEITLPERRKIKMSLIK